MNSTDSSEPLAPPLLRVVTPDATAEEVAALVAVFAAIGAGTAAPARRRTAWSAPARMHRASRGNGGQLSGGYAAGAGWRASGLPC